MILANEKVEKVSNEEYLLMWTQRKSTKVAQFRSISDVMFEHLLVVCETLSENNCVTVYSLPLSRGENCDSGRILCYGFFTLVLGLHL